MSGTKRKKNKYVAGILALALGAFGVHRFYLERPAEGIIFLMLFFLATRISFPITVVLSFIDAMRYFFMDSDKFDAKYNKEYYASKARERKEARYHRQYQEPIPKKTSRRSYKKNPFKTSGEKKYAEYDIDGAIEDLNQALDIHPQSKEIHYLLAKAYSLSEDTEKGFYHLRMAVMYGQSDTEKIMTEDDFAYLRIQPEFEAFRNSGFQRIPSSLSAPEESDTDQQPSGMLLEQLNKLAELRNKGLLSEGEFAREKKKLMSRR